MVQTPLEKIETLKHESFRGSTLYKQQAISGDFHRWCWGILQKPDPCHQATQRKGVAAGERKARKAGLAEEACFIVGDVISGKGSCKSGSLVSVKSHNDIKFQQYYHIAL